MNHSNLLTTTTAAGTFVQVRYLCPARWLVIGAQLLLVAYRISSIITVSGLVDVSQHGGMMRLTLYCLGGMAACRLLVHCENQYCQLISSIY